GADACGSLDAALSRVADAPRACVIGGAEIYALALPRADELVLTEIEAYLDGDVFFPPWDRAHFAETSRERHTSPSGVPFSFVTYRRIGAG
ncbi:MAG TPA: dihydrofolate reductase, partial [Burkholderiaceae bacterium]